MIIKLLQIKKVLHSALLIMLLCTAGMTKAMSQTNTYTLESAPIRDTINAKTVGIIPYSDDFITQEEVMERNYAITSFRMIDTATVAVLTGASDMILVYSLDQNQIQYKIQLPISARAFDYDNNLFHVIGDRTYLTIDSDGMIRERKDFQRPQLPNEKLFIITDLNIIDGRPIIHECNSNTYSITSDGLQEIDTFYYHYARGCKIHPQYIDENSFTLYNETPSKSGRHNISMESLGLEGKLACLDEISVNDDFIAINLQTSHNRTGRFVKSYLLVVNLNGELVNLVEVPINFLSYIHKPFLCKDNAWYYAFSGQEGVSFFKIGTNTNRIDSPDSFMLSDENFDCFYRELENETSREDRNNSNSTRDNWRTITQAWENAERYCNLEWTPQSWNVSGSCIPITSSLYITTPVSNYNTQTGVPYKYGGFTDWIDFIDYASDNNTHRYTGNRHCYYGHNNCYHDPYQNQSDTYVIGVDCSGFVSRCWELPSKLGTTDFPSSTYTQSLGALTSHFNDGTLRTCDALNQLGHSVCTNVPRHVMMYAYHADGDDIVVFESSSNGWKTAMNTYNITYFQGSYSCLLSDGSYTSKPRNYTIQRSNIMRDIRLRLGSAIALSQNNTPVTNVTRGQPLRVDYSVYNGGSETWTGYVRLFIEQSDGDLLCINNCDVDNKILTTIYAGQTKSFTFSNNEVISPAGTTRLYVKVVNYNAGDYGWYHPYDVGDGGYENPLEFQIVEGSGGGGSCKSCPDYDETWNILTDGEWQTRSSSISTDGCRIYRVALLPSYTYTFQTCNPGSASFDTRLYLYNSSCNQVASDDDGCTGTSSSLEYTNTGNAGFYYLKIDGYNGAGGSFTIAGKREGGESPSTCSSCPDYDESWNVNNVEVGEWTTKSSNIGSDGCRIYRVPLMPSYTYTFQTGCDNGTANFDTQLYLYNSDCNEVAYNDDGCSNHLSSLKYKNTTGSTEYYYLKIDGYDGEGGSFTIAAKRESCSNCPEYDEIWPVNNAGVGNWTYKSSSIVSGGCSIYRITLSSSYTYTFQTGCDNGTADFDTQLYLYDESCEQVAYNDDGCPNYLSSIEYTNTGSTAYFYLKIKGYGNAAGSYTIAAKRENPVVNYVIDVSASPSEGGTVGGAGTYQSGSTCTITASPNTGYNFVRWTKNGSQVSTNPSYSFTVMENSSYVAVFSLNSYAISASASPTAGGSVSGTGSYNYGNTCTLTAAANTGYSFTNWTENGTVVSTNTSYSFTVTGNSTFVANFSQNSYTISASTSPSAGGSVSGAGSYNYGSTCTLTATPATGYSFVRWTKNGSQVSTNPSYSFTVTGNASYVAVFSLNSYTISASSNPSAGGSVSGAGSYNYGSTCTLTATPATGYSFVRWTKNGNQVSTNPSYSFAVTENASYVAVFSLNSYTISVSANPLAGGTVSGGGSYNYGSTCTLTASTNEGYAFTNWTENGEVVSTEATYSFTVMGDRSLVAIFEQSASYPISLSDDFNDGVIDPELWTYTGNTVLEEDGLLKLQQNVTDQDVHLRSIDLYIPEDGKVNLGRRFMVHRSHDYYNGRNTIQLNDDPNSIIQIEYVYTLYYDNAYHSDPKTGVYLIIKLDGVESEIRLCDIDFDTWLIERVEVDFTAGTLSYYKNSLATTVTIPGLAEQTVNHYNVEYGPWGWWTGHYHYIDYVNINTLTDDLIAYYPFDGDANDYSGNDYHATPCNSYQYEDGIIGGCIAVEGQGYTGSSGGHVMLPEMDFGGSIGFTLNLWVKALGLSNNDGEAYINFGSDTETDRLYIMQHPDQIRFVYHDAEISFPYESNYTGNWMMYSLTLDENGTLKAYVNGAMVGEENVTFNGINTSLAALGRHWWSGTTYTRFIGSFDEVRIYGRSLSPLEVLMLYGNHIAHITATANPEEGGTISGTGIFNYGETVTLTATPNTDYTFINWTENGEVVSTEAIYSFTVTRDRDLVSNFVEGSEIMVGDGGESTIQYLPSYSYYNYSLTQQIYTADEIGTDGFITSIAFYNGGSEKTRDYDLYLVHTDKTAFESNTDWIAVTEADRVFSGTVNMVANNWITFVLDTPFAYNGVSNLALIVDDNSGNWTSSPHMACRVFDANGNQAIRVYSDGTNYDSYNPSGYGGTLHSVKNQIKLSIIPYELTVHDGTATNGYVPVYGYYTDAYLKSEFIMPASELAQMVGFSINRMKFYASQSNVSWGNASFQVFVKEVDDTTINSYSGLEGATIVYEGSLSISNGMMDVVFTTPYRYGGGNLLIGFYEPTTGSYVASTWYGETVNGASVQGYSYSGLDAINPIQRNFLPKTTFYYQVSGSYQQSIALSVGWNWWSTYLNITLDDLKAALLEALPGTAISIKSQTQNTSYNPNNNRWVGSLAWDVAKMYMIKVVAPCEITFEGLPINPSEHPVSILNGANWIGFPLNSSMTLSNAFAGFAINGDKIKSQTNNALYNGIRWQGQLNALEPGKGYIYISNSSEGRVFTFPTSAK